MVKVTNPGLTSADKDKYLAAVRQAKHPAEATVTRETGSTSGYSEGSDFSKTDSPLSVSSANSSVPDTGVTSQSDTQLSDGRDTVTNDSKTDDTQSQVAMETDVADCEKQSASGVDSKNTQLMESVQTEKVSSGDISVKIESESSEMEKSSGDTLSGSGNLQTPSVPPPSDVTQPLTIETKYSGMSSGPDSESTDTASEVGSCFSSPNSGPSSCQNSPKTGAGISDGKS